VHPVHLEGLGTIQAVAQAKGELLDRVEPTGVVVLNADDPCVMQQAPRTRARIVTFGQSPAADVRIADVRQHERGLAFELHLESGPLSIELPRLGVHNASNAAAAAAIGLIEELDPILIKDRLEAAPAPPMRMEVLELGQTRLLVDCYNANPRSVQAALTTLGQLPGPGQRLAVLGDMLELGQASASLHRQVGRAAAEAGLDGLCAFGPQAAQIAVGAREAGLNEVLHTESIAEAGDWAADKLTPGAWLLLKGSRGMRLERLAETLAAQQGIDWNRGH
jgi:UDP-N-acetylmuramoyl-tripeptide--D-alanyl-D-alanine ligase